MKRTRIACLSVGLAVLAATPALAQGPVELSSSPVPENPSWKSYVLGTGELTRQAGPHQRGVAATSPTPKGSSTRPRARRG